MADTLETLALVGTGVKAGAQIGGGFAAKRTGDFEASQYQANAADARAAGQRSGFEEAAKTSKVLGTQRARASADGGGVVNPTVMDIMGETAGRGAYLAEAERYKGEARARDDMNRATAAKMKGKNAEVGSILEGVGTLGVGVAKYGPALRGSGGTSEPSVSDELLDDEHDLNTNWRTKTRRYG